MNVKTKMLVDWYLSQRTVSQYHMSMFTLLVIVCVVNA